MTPNDLLAGGYRMGRQMIHGFCDDLTEAEFHHQPLFGRELGGMDRRPFGGHDSPHGRTARRNRFAAPDRRSSSPAIA